ncbi:MAG: ABC transporter permease [Acidobacteria bacterium]|nr:ABC transporter permease [Acidobacteriota bacterium]
MLVKQPDFTLIAVLTLALGIGATTAIFSVINGVLLKPLPFAVPERLVAIGATDSKARARFGSLSFPDFADYRAQAQSFERMAAYQVRGLTLDSASGAVRVEGVIASADFFAVLGAQPSLGRIFLPDEDQSGRVAVISQRAWQQRFNRNPNVVGQSLTINSESYSIIGVMPPGFQFPWQEEPLEVWINYAAEMKGDDAQGKQRGNHYLRAIGLLKPGFSATQSETELVTIASRLEQQFPNDNHGFSARAQPLLQSMTGEVSRALWVIFAAVGCVLLIACANVANLMLARALHRQRELAVRAALGAGRWRIIRQLLTESLLLALAGGAVGVWLASFGMDALLALTPANVPRIADAGIDYRVLLFTLAATTLTGVVMGLLPAWQAARADVQSVLKESGRGNAGGRATVRNALVVAEVALAVVLLVGAGLLMRSFAQLLRVNPGFNPQQMVTLRIGLPDARYTQLEQIISLHNRVLERVSALPGVTAAATVAPMPLSGSNYSLGLAIENRPNSTGRAFPFSTRFFMAGAGCFTTLGARVVQGREFEARDTLQAAPVAVINEAFARTHFPNENPLGQRIKLSIGIDDTPEAWRAIVGVVSDMRTQSPNLAPVPEAYLHTVQMPAFGSFSLLLRSALDASQLAAAVRREIAQLDAAVPVSHDKLLEAYLHETLSQPRFSSLLIGLFAGLALLLTAIGLYGVVAYTVTQRTQEIGLRLALGAQTRDVLRLVLGQGMKLVFIGATIGLIGAFAAARVLNTLLFGVTPTDPLTFGAVTAFLIGVGLLACWIPARRATKVDPMIALRCE